MNFFETIVLDKLNNANGGVSDFFDLFNGIYLGEIYNVLKDITDRSIIINEGLFAKAKYFYNEFQLPCFSREKYKNVLHDINYFPVPHILDSDWRFSKETALHLLEIIRSYSQTDTDNFIMIGAPSIFSLLEEKADFNFAKLLIDQNFIYNGNIRKNNIICNDISSFELYNFADIVLCDPPWYLPAIKNFVNKAHAMMRCNAYLILALPPSEVRDTIKDEYKEIDLFTKKLGFELICQHEDVIRYVSPPFEVNSLLSIGIQNFPIFWRKGVLQIYQKKVSQILKQKSFIPFPEIWYDLTIQNVRFKIRIKENNNLQNEKDMKYISISPIVHNNIYPTVSMRGSLKDRVDIWTSGNRIYNCNNTLLFKFLCNKIIKLGFENYNYDNSEQEADNVKHAINLIKNIVQEENKEYADVWGPLC
jgi:hypothetical protein